MRENEYYNEMWTYSNEGVEDGTLIMSFTFKLPTLGQSNQRIYTPYRSLGRT